ncbi:U3 small nucleolar RNA-associated protein 4 homolog [Bicyclus anynana]|uniref:U3 small nucleolar RNA-associated protein 4 homolog n=1 Tax=Bicyclus anynana TaxID=110368 RepID=A0A6J1MUU3_BICAN|nr:U3 small nucleolar RNA-associated protein 4 homolog [Bicyclus anynana]
MACKLHRVRYYNPKPVQVNCVAFNKSNKLLALARQDASIEIWDLNYAPYLIKCIPGVENTSVEALGWVNERLLSTGLGGALVEWDTDKLSIKYTVMLTGYAAWCLDVNSAKELVAVGTEQGYVNLYSVENDEIVYRKLFDKQEGRIICCKFDQPGNILATGSIDSIRVWNVETGQATCRISVARRGKETIVWCLAVLSDGVVVSGDRYGRLTFWDSNLGDQIESYTTHKRDILCIAVSDDENSMYLSGVDPVIVQFVKVKSGSNKQTSANWVKNVQRNIHEHDVRALAINGEKLISVGADGYLTLSSYPPKWVMRIPPMVPYPRSSVCAGKKLLLLRYSNYLEVWKLGSYAVNKNGNVILNNTNIKKEIKQENTRTQLEEDTEVIAPNEIDRHDKKQKQTLKLTEQPLKLVSIQAKGKKQIKCCELSPSGELVVYSTESHIRMLKLECDDESNISLTKVLISGITCCDRVAFTADSRTLVACCSGELKILQVDPEAGATVIQTIACDKYLKTKSILHLVVSKVTPTSYIVAADTMGRIAVWIKKAKKFEFYVTLPKYHCVLSAITIDDRRETLIVVYVDQKIVEYSLVDKQVTSSNKAELHAEWSARTAPVVSLSAHPLRDALVLEDDVSLWVLDNNTTSDFEEQPSAPKKKQKWFKKLQTTGLHVIPLKYLSGFHWLGDDEAVTLEILPENIVSQLPPGIGSKKHAL